MHPVHPFAQGATPPVATFGGTPSTGLLRTILRPNGTLTAPPSSRDRCSLPVPKGGSNSTTDPTTLRCNPLDGGRPVWLVADGSWPVGWVGGMFSKPLSLQEDVNQGGPTTR